MTMEGYLRVTAAAVTIAATALLQGCASDYEICGGNQACMASRAQRSAEIRRSLDEFANSMSDAASAYQGSLNATTPTYYYTRPTNCVSQRFGQQVRTTCN